MKAVLQINLTGEGDGEFYMVIQEGRCLVHEGKAENATTVITSPADVWLSIARGGN
jgi:putative sterol carrier protein